MNQKCAETTNFKQKLTFFGRNYRKNSQSSLPKQSNRLSRSVNVGARNHAHGKGNVNANARYVNDRGNENWNENVNANVNDESAKGSVNVNGIGTVNAKEIAIEMIVKRNAITATAAGRGVATEVPVGTRIAVGVVKENVAMIVAETDHVFFLNSYFSTLWLGQVHSYCIH